MPVNEEFKRLIDKIKYEFSINQAQISERLGVKSTYLSDMINGRVPYNESLHLLNSLGNLLIVKAIFIATRKNTRKRRFFIGFLMS